MTHEFSDILSCNDISYNDIFVSSAAHKLGVIFADIESVDIIVMNIFVVFDHEIFGRVVQAYASIFRAGQAVLSSIIELDNINRPGVSLC